jgi:pyrimidine operon attenuation protein / uracil phosphoribosyltransferase
MSQKVLLTSKEVNIILHRLACQLIEKHHDFSDSILIGIQPRGTFLAERLKDMVENEYNIPKIALGYLDITFFRDDFRRTNKPLEANKIPNFHDTRSRICTNCGKSSNRIDIKWCYRPLYDIR